LEHRSLIEQAVEILVDREGLDAPAALEWLERRPGRRESRWSRWLVRCWWGAAALRPLAQARRSGARPPTCEVAGHRRDSELHEGAARRFERRGQAGRAQSERLQAAAAAAGSSTPKAERRRANREPEAAQPRNKALCAGGQPCPAPVT
jgi:hypothetical protein